MAAPNVRWIVDSRGEYTGVSIDGEYRPIGAIPAGWQPGTPAPPGWLREMGYGGHGSSPWTMPLIVGSLAIVAGALYYYYGRNNE